ncbi:hypothetical protein EHQ58_09925 [Leptospira ognonensis]|uniref:Uncharacterized protein n=1 Tax=Leptospira ognonensis TaxID=2484945 RepID=A0A4R9K4N7_9LEPT|nr:hypothetical protein [Leptospira ognonensis]TGL59217.1 hypothetical protein EHQ58_09925 [Leptospira ognonensis]
MICSCSRHYLGDPLDHKSIQGNKKFAISYELVGWGLEDDKIHASEVLSTLHKSGEFAEVKSAFRYPLENRIQIILQSSQRIKIFFGEQSEPVSRNLERNPTKMIFTFVNRVLLIRTFFIVPFFQKEKTSITFRHWKENRIVKDYTYSLDNYIVIGWVPLLFRPFDDHKEIESIYAKATEKFISDFYGDNL